MGPQPDRQLGHRCAFTAAFGSFYRPVRRLVLARVSAQPKFVVRRGVKQFIKFGLVGATGAVVSFVIFHALLHFFRLDLRLAFSIGFIAGGVNNYWWNRHWTFRSRGHMGKELVQFLTVSSMALILGIVITGTLDKYLPPFHL